MKGKFESMMGGFDDDPLKKEAPVLKIAQSDFNNQGPGL